MQIQLTAKSHLSVRIDHARYLLVRLCLRKTDKWHRLGALKYEGELGDNIRQAIAELCGKATPLDSVNSANAVAMGQTSGSSVKFEPLHLTQELLPFAEVKVEPEDASIPDAPAITAGAGGPEINVVAMDADDTKQPGPAPQVALVTPQEETVPPLEAKACIVFAEDESGASLRDLLECLTVEELKTVAKQFKVKGSAKVCTENVMYVVNFIDVLFGRMY